MSRSAAKASISRTRSPSAFGAALGPMARWPLTLNQLFQRHSVVGHRHLRFRLQVSQAKPSQKIGDNRQRHPRPRSALRRRPRARPPTPRAGGTIGPAGCVTTDETIAPINTLGIRRSLSRRELQLAEIAIGDPVRHGMNGALQEALDQATDAKG